VYGVAIGLGVTTRIAYGYGWQSVAGYRWALPDISSLMNFSCMFFISNE